MPLSLPRRTILVAVLLTAFPVGNVRGQDRPAAVPVLIAPAPEIGCDPPAKDRPASGRQIHVRPGQTTAQRLRSPREALQSFYYALTVYDLCPPIISEAIEAMDLGDLAPPDSAAAALLAVQLETVLAGLDLTLGGVPEHPSGDVVKLFEGEGMAVGMRRGADGLWRFDRPTLERVPAMWRVAQAKRRIAPADRAALRDGYTDPRTTMHRFWRDVLGGDYAAAAQALDLGGLTTSQRRERGPALAQMLGFVLQRRGFTFAQLFPDSPTGPPFTWHSDSDGRVALERVAGADGKAAWLFGRATVDHLPRMYAAALPAVPENRFTRLGLLVPPLNADGTAASHAARPATVPARLGSARALLRGFFRAMDAAESSDARLTEAIDCLDLDAIPTTDRRALGGTLAGKLEAVLRAMRLDLSGVPDEWDAAPQTLSDSRGLKVNLARQADGCWRFTESTVSLVPELFDKLAPKERGGRERSGQFDSARDTAVTFLNAVNAGDLAGAAHCLDLHEFLAGARDELGPVLACKLKFVLDRTGRIYIQEVPDDADGPRHALYRGELGRIVLGKATAGPRAGAWLFTPETVRAVEAMFKTVQDREPDASVRDIAEVMRGPEFAHAPGVWLRLRLPAWARTPVGPLDGYQWVGLVLAVTLSGGLARVVLGAVHRVVAWLLHKGGSNLRTDYVARKLRPLTWLGGFWLFFRLLALLDLPAGPLDEVLALKKFLLAGLIAWFGCRLIDLVMAVYTDTELLRPHRSLGDMIAPVTVRVAKAGVVLVVLTYLVYLVGQGELLGRFLTGLGVAGLAASLAAQDALKSFYGTLLLIGERSFKLGDRISVNGQEGLVEQVGFRATRLRTKEGSLLTIPNSTIATASINNLGPSAPAPQAKAA